MEKRAFSVLKSLPVQTTRDLLRSVVGLVARTLVVDSEFSGYETTSLVDGDALLHGDVCEAIKAAVEHVDIRHTISALLAESPDTAAYAGYIEELTPTEFAEVVAYWCELHSVVLLSPQVLQATFVIYSWYKRHK